MDNLDSCQIDAGTHCPPTPAAARPTRWRPWRTWVGLLLAGIPFVPGLRGQPEALPEIASPAPHSATALSATVPRWPRLAPDYVEVVIPPNLAPLNLTIREEGAEYRLRLAGSRGQALTVQQSQAGIRFPPREWRDLLQASRGDRLVWTLAVRSPAGAWVTYAPFATPVAEEAIDPYIVYRRLRPLYSTYRHLAVYQRHLESFDEQPILRNDRIAQGCVNCHTFRQGDPDRFALSFRGRFGTPTLLTDSNRVARVDLKLGYLAWHPHGRLLAFAANDITQFFHLAGPLNRDVFDAHSDLGILHVADGRVEKPAVIAAPDRNENWPSWSPDGRHLYYCSGPTVPFEEARHFRYDLMRVAYDPDRQQWGQPERLLSGAEHGLSAHQPRVAPDGRHLVFTVTESGSFPLFRPDSDLCLLDLTTRRWERLPINSAHAETWHCWSSNGRWLAYVSRGLDGVFARVLLTHFGPDARFSKPLLLPQEEPAYYETCLDNFNAPELSRGPLRITEDELVRAYTAPGETPGATDQDYPERRSHR